jgi:hypothetical protein
MRVTRVARIGIGVGCSTLTDVHENIIPCYSHEDVRRVGRVDE